LPLPPKEKKKRKPARANVLPTKAEILEFLASSPRAVGKGDIARAFGLKGDYKIGLKALMKEMQEEGHLERNRKQIKVTNVLAPVTIIDIIELDDDGDLYGVPSEWTGEGERPRVLIGRPSQLREAKPPKPGDRILARIDALAGENYGHKATPLKNLSTRETRSLGIYKEYKGDGRVLSIDKKSKHDFLVRQDETMQAQDGELVSIEVQPNAGRGLPRARIVQRLGDVSDPRNISRIAIQQHGVPNSFPERVIAESEALKPFDRGGRADWRHIPLITIDPVDARDHDDAVFAEPEGEGWRVIVAIADVAAYVRPQTPLDREARVRGNSTYFPDLVVPMLPERISNDLCSLREGEERPALAVEMMFDKDGQKQSHKFYRIIMRSAAKLAYEDAQAAIEGRGSDKAKAILEKVLKPLWQAYAALGKARDLRAPLELDLPERKIILDEQGMIARVIVPERLDAHRLIEEFMIQANVAAAEELEKKRTPLLYRVHDEPSKEKLRALADFLQTTGQKFSLGQVLQTRHFNRMLAEAKGQDHERALHDVVLRTQAQAVYLPSNAGHFGLSLRRYAHFTSPIRRYADLIVHRALVSALNFGEDGLSQVDASQLEETAEMISGAERRSMLAERETVDRLVAAFMAGQMGAEFSGRISGVVGAGLFVRLNETGADGFVPASTLGRAYFRFDAARHALIAEGTGETYQLGDQVDVRLMEATPVKGGLRFEVISEGRAGKASASMGKPKFKGKIKNKFKGKRR
jgi:ribonuclease R